MNNITASKYIALYVIVMLPVVLISKFRLGVSIVLGILFALPSLNEAQSAGDLLLFAIVAHVLGIAVYCSIDYACGLYVRVATAIVPERMVK